MLSEKRIQQAQYVMLSLAMLLIVGTSILPLFNVYWAPAKWIYAFGAVLALAERLTERYQGAASTAWRNFRRCSIACRLISCVSVRANTPPNGWLSLWLAP